MVRKLCLWLSKRLNHVTINVPDPVTGVKAPYLTRYYLFGKDRRWGNIYLHQFHSSDLDIGKEGFGLLHNHPFAWSFSFVLIAGYKEERLNKNGIINSKIVKPFSFNFLSKKDFHRVDLINNQKAWTIFFTGSRSSHGSWGFYDRISRKYKDFTTSENAIP